MFDIDTDIVDMYMQQTILKVQNGGVKSIGKVYLPNLDYIDNSILKTIVPFHYFCTNSVKLNIIYGLLYFYTYEKDPFLYSMLYYIFLCITNNMKMRTDIKNYILQEINSVRMAYSDMYNEYYMPVLFYKFISDCVLKLC